MHDRNTTAHEQCERSRRTAGFPAQRSCRICQLGPCSLGIGEPEPVALKFNRLHGAVINERGEAI